MAIIEAPRTSRTALSTFMGNRAIAAGIPIPQQAPATSGGGLPPAPGEGLPRVTFVSPLGDNNTAQTDSFFPFKTIQAALAAMALNPATHSGDELVLLPGTYNESVVIPNTLLDLTITGTSTASVTVIPTGNSAFSSTAGAVAAQIPAKLQIQNLTIDMTSHGTTGVAVDGAAAFGQNPYANGLVLNDLVIINGTFGLDINCVSKVFDTHVDLRSNAYKTLNVALLTSRSLGTPNVMTVQYLFTSPQPGGTNRGGFEFFDATIAQLSLDGEFILFANKGTTVDGIFTANSIGTAGNNPSNITFLGAVSGDVNLVQVPLFLASATWDFSGALIGGNFTATKSNNAVDPILQYIDLRGATIGGQISNSSQTANFVFDIRGGSYEQIASPGFDFVNSFLDRDFDAVVLSLLPANLTTLTFGTTAQVSKLPKYPGAGSPFPTTAANLYIQVSPQYGSPDIGAFTDFPTLSAVTNVSFTINNRTGAPQNLRATLIRRDQT